MFDLKGTGFELSPKNILCSIAMTGSMMIYFGISIWNFTMISIHSLEMIYLLTGNHYPIRSKA